MINVLSNRLCVVAVERQALGAIEVECKSKIRLDKLSKPMRRRIVKAIGDGFYPSARSPVYRLICEAFGLPYMLQGRSEGVLNIQASRVAEFNHELDAASHLVRPAPAAASQHRYWYPTSIGTYGDEALLVRDNVNVAISAFVNRPYVIGWQAFMNLYEKYRPAYDPENKKRAMVAVMTESELVVPLRPTDAYLESLQRDK